MSMSRPAPVINYETVGPLGLLPAEVLQLIFAQLSPIQQFKINVIPDLRAIFNQDKVHDISGEVCKGYRNLKYDEHSFMIMVFLYTYCGMYEDIKEQYFTLIKGNSAKYSTSAVIYPKYSYDELVGDDIVNEKLYIIDKLKRKGIYMNNYDVGVFIDIILYGYINKWTENHDSSFKTYQSIDLDINTNRDIAIPNYDYDNPVNRIIALYTSVLHLITAYSDSSLFLEDQKIIADIFYRHFSRYDHFSYMYLFLSNMARFYLAESGDVDSYYNIYSDKSISALLDRFLKYYVCPDNAIQIGGQIYRVLINHREFIPHLQYIFAHDTYKTHYRSWVKFIKITKETPNKLIPRLKAIHIALKLR